MGHRKFDSTGFRRFWEVKIPTGPKRADGSRPFAEGFLDIKTGKPCVPEKGWNGAPPTPEDFVPAATHSLGGTDELWESMRLKAIADAEAAGVAPPLWTRR